jgi:GH35 family endo-1,4-beta-xylanase/peptidoglycan/xylan/chitin deacetylase (PgdA/CDA1 family)
MTLYVETPQDSGELTDFYIDVAQGSKSGVKSSVVTGQGKVGSSSDPGSVDPGTTDPVPTVSSGSTGHANRDYTYTKGGSGFKDHAGPLFRLGTSVSQYELNSGNTGKDFILKNYNSITCENEMKPDSTVKGVNGTDVTISLNDAKPALDFASKNGLGVRGHTFVWYQQTPEFFFKDGNGYASKATMDKRLENMIKNTFSALNSQYPNLKLYAYDVCNELFINDGGAMRDTLEDGGEMWGTKQGSRWVSIYGKDNPEYIINAFKYARKYAPPTCKLYMNDFNEYMPKKRMDLYNMAKKIMAEGDYIDGIGMQSHLSDRYPSASEYEEAIELFASLGLDVQVTELDITNELGGNDKAYPQIFQKIADHANNISSVTLWGTTDERSWRANQNGGSPLPFSNYQPKSFYNEILNILDKTPPVTTAGGQTPTTTTTTTSVTPTIVTQVIDEKEELNKKVSKWGDANNDGTTELADAIFIMQALANPNKYSLTAQGKYNGDVYEAGEGITANDALAIQKKLLGLINTLPESYSSKLSTKVVTVTGNTPQVQTTTTKSQQSVVTNTPSSAGKGSINSNFDSGAGSWSARSASVAATSDAYYGSSGKALEISGRSQEWNGAAISLGSDFKVGETYSVSLAALQVAKDNATIQISLQQGEGDSASYTSIAKAECKKGTWTKIENTSFTIPDNSGDMILYVETVQDSGDLMDFYIDNVVVAAEGTKSSVTTGGQGKVPEPKTVTTPGVDTSKKLCAIAFDDGASASSRTDPAYRIMDALIKNNMTATFFYVSDWIKTNEQVKFAYQNGMEVANHTKSHPEGGLSKLSSDQIRYQWSECNSKLKSIIGTEPSHLMRLPYLDGGGQVTTALYDVPLIDCAIDTKDWSNASKDQIVQTIKNAANDGSLQGAIVLCHENYATTAAAMEEVLPWLAQNGYQNVNISDMAAAKGKTLQGGVIYKRV